MEFGMKQWMEEKNFRKFMSSKIVAVQEAIKEVLYLYFKEKPIFPP